MMRRLSSFFTALLGILFLASCSTGKKYTAASRPSSRQPKFISGMYISGHAKNNETANAIEPVKKAEKPKLTYPKYVPPPEAPAPHTVAASAPANAPVSLSAPAPEVYYASAAPDNAMLMSRDIPPAPMPDIANVAEASVLRSKYSEMLGITSNDITNYPLFNFIDNWYGTNYRLGGSDKDGIDCSGFARKLYGDVYGIDLLRTAMEQYSNCKRLKKSDEAEEGDLVFFRVHSKKRITHVGVYLANNYFIHASTTGGVMISNLNEEYWRKHFAGCGKVARLQ